MFLQNRADGGWRIMTSASDLTAASMCEFAFLRRVDARLGRDVEVPLDDDAMLARAARLGDAHEERVLAEYRARLGEGTAGSAGGVVEIDRCDPRDEAELGVAAESTVRALAGGADIVFQATFFDATQRAADLQRNELEIGFLGFADFLQRTSNGSYEVQDTKLARRAKVTALMQLAAYAEQLERLGLPVTEEGVLILGNGAQSRHRIADIAPVFRSRRRRLHRLILDRVAACGADGRRESASPTVWGEGDITACGRCEVCGPEIERSRDPLLIAGIRRTQRDALLAAGVRTIDDVARLDTALNVADGMAEPELTHGSRAFGVQRIPPRALERLSAQAAVQLETERTGTPAMQVVDAAAIAAVPEPNEGDLFFDFEGDPMYREPGSSENARWGIDYLFGMIDQAERFTAIWAHDLEAEKRALLDFLDLVAERRRRFPGMRIYHYAAYERTHLSSIAARHGVGETDVDELLREHVLVDLYPIVRAALRIGSRSYSIKKLEPFYMGNQLRDEDGVTNGAESVTEYAEASAQLFSNDAAEQAEGQRRIDSIADYNRYDCVSTLRLRDWLLEIGAAYDIRPHRIEASAHDSSPELQLSDVAAQLKAHAETQEQPADRQAVALAASAIDYHQREQKSFWWEHFARLVDPIEDWADTRDVMIVDPATSYVSADWFVPPRGRSARRQLRLRGTVAPGSRLRVGSDVFALYAPPAPFAAPGAAPGARGARRVKIVEVHETDVVVEEFIGDAEEYRQLPEALVPGPPPPAGSQKGAIEEWGQRLAHSLDQGQFPRDPVIDLLRRAAPSFIAQTTEMTNAATALIPVDSDQALAAAGGDADGRTIAAVVSSAVALDRSFIAVQGPPGTGKTYLAARVIKRLVEEHGWRIGVVAQSHKVVENVLEGVVKTGLAPQLIGKVPQGGSLEQGAQAPAYSVIPKNGHLRFVAAHREAGQGCVIGGTAWDFSNPTRFERGSLDLLVIDEAGQFSLAPTIAASVAAERLLLLGDPQQLPQVSQGSHPEPVDSSALGWLLGEHETMPAELGYFLSETRRMRPELTEVVSALAYDGRLQAHPSASDRVVSNAGPAGVVWHPIAHRGNSTHSPEEAERIVLLIQKFLSGSVQEGAEWRPLTVEDIIVVAPYNAHVECIAEAIEAADLHDIRVGTVDRFQGQEAVLAVVSLAASSPEDVPRGLEFLLMRNRLNVGISRAQWAAHLVTSDRLGGGLPQSVEGLSALSGYLGLLERAVSWDS